MTKKITYFVIAILIQSLILAAVPAKKLYTLHTGQVVKLKTVPVDPYDFLSGYYVTLNYEISVKSGQFKDGSTVYTVITPDANGIYNFKSISDTWPKDLGSGDVVIKGKAVENWRGNVQYGIESYFIPEDMRQSIEKRLRRDNRNVIIEVKVDKFGNSAILRILIDGQAYEY